MAELGELPDIRGDFHVPTNATDGTEPLEAMVEAARRRGYAFVGISDHSVSATVAGGMTADQALSRRDRVRSLNQELKASRSSSGRSATSWTGARWTTRTRY